MKPDFYTPTEAAGRYEVIQSLRGHKRLIKSF